jgi:hypothetical protein
MSYQIMIVARRFAAVMTLPTLLKQVCFEQSIRWTRQNLWSTYIFNPMSFPPSQILNTLWELFIL